MRTQVLSEGLEAGKCQGYVKTLSVLLNPQDNGGESAVLSVDVYDNGDGLSEGMFTNTSLETTCYGVHSTKITFWGVGFDSIANAVKLIEDKLKTLKESK